MVTVVLGLGLLALACGDDDGDGGTPDEPTVVDEAEEPEEGSTEEPEATEPPSSGEGIDACSLITAEEASDAVGGAVGTPEQSDIGENFNQCAYTIEGGTIGLDSSVVVQARGNMSRDDFERLVEENSPEEAGTVEPVEGLGDAAYQHVATFVLEGDAMVVITVLNEETLEQQEQRQQDLARVALGRLP
jgi:hypothetical protein